MRFALVQIENLGWAMNPAGILRTTDLPNSFLISIGRAAYAAIPVANNNASVVDFNSLNMKDLPKSENCPES
jgi:hypothetical protein